MTTLVCSLVPEAMFVNAQQASNWEPGAQTIATATVSPGKRNTPVTAVTAPAKVPPSEARPPHQ
jgi:hypothetical protein